MPTTKDSIDVVMDVLRELYNETYTTIRLYLNSQLTRFNSDNANSWYRHQLANQTRVRKKLELIYREQQRKIDKVNERAKEIVDFKVTSKFNIKNIVPAMAKQYRKDIKAVYSSSRRANIDELKKAIYHYTSSQAMPPKIIYTTESGSKREVNWSSYMEMNVRTTLNNNLVEDKIATSDGMNDVFYVFDHFSDCAPDHVDYQDLVYYGENINYSEEAQKYIDENNLMSYESVVNGEPYMERRPNCRHQAKRIPFSMLSGGEYKQRTINRGRDYESVQQQRYNERQIRKYKERVANDKINGVDTHHNQALVTKWQKEQRQLVDKENLHRDYRREKINYLVQDLGVKYQNLF